MEQVELKASLRTKTGKGAAHQLRSQGQIPAILYGRGMETYPLTLNPAESGKY